jgi:hypothetical protein
MPGQLLAAQHGKAPSVWGMSTGWWKKENVTMCSLLSPGGPCQGNDAETQWFLLHSCNSNTGGIRANPPEGPTIKAKRPLEWVSEVAKLLREKLNSLKCLAIGFD